MARISKQEFAEKCSVTTSALAVYIGPKRRQVVVGEDGLIDEDDPKNRLFYELRVAKRLAKKVAPAKKDSADQQKNSSKDKKKKSIAAEPGADGSVQLDLIQDLDVSVKEEKYLKTIQLKLQNEKLEQELMKKKGEVVPVALMQPVFTQHNQNMMMGFKNVCEEVLRKFGKLKGLSNEEQVEVRALFNEGINKVMKDSTTQTVASTEAIIQQLIDERK